MYLLLSILLIEAMVNLETPLAAFLPEQAYPYMVLVGMFLVMYGAYLGIKVSGFLNALAYLVSFGFLLFHLQGHAEFYARIYDTGIVGAAGLFLAYVAVPLVAGLAPLRGVDTEFWETLARRASRK